MAFISHKRGTCKHEFAKLKPAKLNNTRCILLHTKNAGPLMPADVTFNDKTWLENSCELLGINHECIIIDKPKEKFAYTDKIPTFLNYLKTCNYEYALIADSTDSVVLSNPDNAINLLDEYDCDILFSNTAHIDWDQYTMPDRAKFNNEKFGSRSYVNTGVCIGKTSTLIELYERVLEYAEYDPIWVYHPTYRKTNGYMNWTKEQQLNFPKGCSDDQTIIRYLIKDFWPKIKVDTQFKLACKR